ncbi:50S ribosomal protein L15 [Pseudenhygromyxa sp. WMMC2535]|uniref:50S ribosomal protein L15 n=1 Tax=Pseudenhygromyxa sp. WMMC2535 TaxID=2712867 RepID=UPI0015576989|nr:50S ribosomal protein L15 [Pseudenhygromyxa sp. WMMC2535]NVB36804.1 50S ribosomal protein L15 [Pseudenhygromyxa sp. WMMC2535]
MGTELHTLKPPAGARKRKKRLGRGPGSGTGKTAGRGMKGQRARNTVPLHFEGGQNPLHRRVPKRGFTNIYRVEVHGVNLDRLEQLEAGTEVTPELLHERGFVPKKATIIKVLGSGELTKKLVIKVHRISASARAKVEAAGGSIELIGAKAEEAPASEG